MALVKTWQAVAMALLGVACLVQGGMLFWSRGALQGSEFERARCAQDLKAREAEAETLSGDVTRLVAEKTALELRLKRYDDQPRSAICEIDKLQWIARIEAGAGVPAGTFKKNAEGNGGTLDERRRFGAAILKYPPPPCTGLDPLDKGSRVEAIGR